MTSEIEYNAPPKKKNPDDPDPDEIRVLCTQFRLKTLMGIGMYGAIFSVHDDKTRVVKCVNNIAPKKPEDKTHDAKKEIEMLSRVHHHNVISLLSTTYTERYIYMLFERFDCDLYQMMQMKEFGGGQGVDRGLAGQIMMQICAGLAACHANGVIHRDVKPTNILVDLKRMRIVLADFGISKYIGADQITGQKPTSHSLLVVSYPYRAPEIVLDKDVHYDEKIDVWAAGCIFVELLSGTILFNSASKESLLGRVMKRFLAIDWDDVSKHRSRLWYVNVQMEPQERKLWLAMMRREPILRLGARDSYSGWLDIWSSRLNTLTH